MSFLQWLAAFRSPVLNAVMQFFTFFGEETLFLVVALFIFWCVSKKHGYYVLITGFFGITISQFLKLVFQVPRPWIRQPGFQAVPSALEGADGFSFPSGHTQNAVGTYGCIARFTKKNWLRWISIALALLVCFSRMYLGVHTPIDVAVALVIAVVLLLVLYPIVEKIDQKPAIMYVLSAVMLAFCIAYVCYVNFVISPADFAADSVSNYYSGVENGWKLLGALLALPIIYTVDLKKLHFQTEAPVLSQLLKTLLGLICVLALKEGLKLAFNAVFGTQAIVMNLFRYFVIVIFAGCIWPMSFPFFRKLGKK